MISLRRVYMHLLTYLLTYKRFVSKEVSLLCRAFKVYVRPLLEYASCVWSSHLIKDIERLERDRDDSLNACVGCQH